MYAVLGYNVAEKVFYTGYTGYCWCTQYGARWIVTHNHKQLIYTPFITFVSAYTNHKYEFQCVHES